MIARERILLYETNLYNLCVNISDLWNFCKHFYCSFLINLNKSQKWKKASRSAEIDYGEENKMFLEFIFNAT